MVCQKVLCVNIMICLISSIICISCAKTIDVTDNDVVRGQYRKGMVLIAKKDILIMHSGMLWDHQSEIDIFKSGYRRDDYKGILKRGTKVKIVKVELYSHVEIGNEIYPIALVIDGEWKDEEVNLHFTSKSSDRPENDSYYIDILDVDPEVFEIVNE